MLAVVAWFSAAFSDSKTLIEYGIGFHNDALHVFVGAGLQIGFAMLLRRSVGDWLPWILVLVLELANEAHDVFYEVWPEPSMQAGEGLKDFLLTMLLPTVLLLLVRWKPGLFIRADRPREQGS